MFLICIREYWNYKKELTVQDGILYKEMKVIIRASMRPQMIAIVHSSHLGAEECVRRTRDVFFGQARQAKSRKQFRTVKSAMTFFSDNRRGH